MSFGLKSCRGGLPGKPGAPCGPGLPGTPFFPGGPSGPGNPGRQHPIKCNFLLQFSIDFKNK